MRIIDGTIPLGAICIAAEWHFATAIDFLVQAGLKRMDAEQFASLEFHARAQVTDSDAETHLISEENLNRITDL